MLILLIYSKLKLGYEQSCLLFLPISAARIFKIVPKGPYKPIDRLHNNFIATIIIIHKNSHKDEKFCILECL